MKGKYGVIRFMGMATVALGLLSFVVTSVAQTNASASAPKPVPRMADGHPDLSGFWLAGRSATDFREELFFRLEDGSTVYTHSFGPPQPANAPRPAADPAAPRYSFVPSYKPEYLEEVKNLGKFSIDNVNPADPDLACKPAGIPRATVNGGTGGLQIVQNPSYIALLYEDAPGPFYRLIYTDGRPHPKNWDSTYFGHSIGHWEGDTLVVDTVGLNDETALATPARGGPYGGWLLLHSDQEHVIERWSRRGDQIFYEATVEDPVMFTKPWVTQPKTTTLAKPTEYLMPAMCIVHDAKYIARQLESGTAKIDYDRLGDIHYRPEGEFEHKEVDPHAGTNPGEEPQR